MYHRHTVINDIIHRALTSADVSARLEPPGLFRSDGKRPDGVSMVRGDLESFWCGMTCVLTLLLHLTGAWLSKQRVRLWRKLRP